MRVYTKLFPEELFATSSSPNAWKKAKSWKKPVGGAVYETASADVKGHQVKKEVLTKTCILEFGDEIHLQITEKMAIENENLYGQPSPKDQRTKNLIEHLMK